MTDLFGAAWRGAYVAQLASLLPGRCADDLGALPFADTVAALGHEGEVALGRQDVDVDAIVGSVSRVGDFDRLFRPRNRHLRERWEALARLERDLPPVRLIRLNDLHFVEDGHHRVSLARARGASTVRADVRRIRTTACASRRLTVADLPTKAAERLLLERVPLPEDVRVGLQLDEPADWRRLAEAAEAWGFRQSLAGRSLGGRCELAEAWWAEEVLPLVEQLRERGICVSGAGLDAYARELATPVPVSAPPGAPRSAPR